MADKGCGRQGVWQTRGPVDKGCGRQGVQWTRDFADIFNVKDFDPNR